MNQLNISYNNILRIAYPVMVGGIAQNIINVTDTAFLGQLGEIAIGAAGNGGLLYMTFFILGFGFSAGMQVIIARRNGEKNYKEIGLIVDHGFYFLFGISLFLFLIMKFLSPLFLSLVTQSDAIYEACMEYMDYRAWGIFFAMINSVFRGLYIGITKTKVLTLSTTIMAVVNVFFDYVLVFGNWGFPEMGIKGAALASVIAEITATLCFILYTYKQIDIATYNLFSFSKFNKQLMQSMLKISLPAMYLYFFALFSWYLFFLIIEQTGERPLAISHIVRSIHSVLQIPLFGLGAAANTMVSNIIGQNQRELVMKLIRKTVMISIVCAFIVLQVNLFLPEWMISIYTKSQSLIQATLPVLYIISISIFFFSTAHVLFQSVAGTGNTRMAFKIEMFAITLYLFFAILTALVLHLPVYIIWCSELVYSSVLGGAAFYYLKKGNWREWKV